MPITTLATYGLRFDGVLQMTRPGDPSSRAFRMDCPRSEDFACLKSDPNGCRYLEGFRRNRVEGTFWILCGCTQRKKVLP